ncbi:hypothetical protein [Nocardioides mangrovi]|uniref:Uncharacterized protein n=1 Tax=Nocardioides mangrovi TaxID=2874580 RepID=A0ABS7UB76_9ACTN|nr:hypothetical protein [Nocardioides mangrovi]MBZ5737907.1 hypothetical protein [Nocardioides mangrovi]
MREARWIVVLLGFLVACLLVAALVSGSPVGVGGAVVASAAPVCWWRGDRARDRGARTGDRTAYLAEFAWSVVAVCLLGTGYAVLVLALSHGW